MKQRIITTLLILLAFALIGLAWWSRPTSNSVPTSAPLARQKRSSENPAIPPTTPAVEIPVLPQVQASGPSVKGQQKDPRNDLGPVDFGESGEYGGGFVTLKPKFFTLNSGRILAISAGLERDGAIHLIYGLFNSEEIDVNAEVFWLEYDSEDILSTKPGERVTLKLKDGELAYFTPKLTPKSNDLGVLDLGEINLQDGESRQFSLNSGRILVFTERNDSDGKGFFLNTFEAGEELTGVPISSSGSGGVSPGVEITEELGDEAVKFRLSP